jgi:hypothetical protein
MVSMTSSMAASCAAPVGGALPLVEGSAAEPVVRRAVVVGMVGHWLELGDEWASGRGALVEWGRWLANVAGQMR